MAYRNADDRRRARAERQRKIFAFVTEYKRQAACAQCGERHPGCLQFHHRNAKDKDFAISSAVFGGWGMERIMEEIAKCDVLCANCHAKYHWGERAMADTQVNFSFIERDIRHGASQQKKPAFIA